MASEAIADIVAEMRYGAIPKHQTDHELLALYADRIEAAAKRDAAIHAMTCEANERLREHLEIALENDKRTVGNAAAMREALEFIKFASDDYETYGNTKAGALYVIYEKACAALAAPLRNCDVGTAVQQARRYDNFIDRYNPCSYRGYARCAEDCPVHIKLTQEGYGELLCQLEWAQMPYDEGGAK